MTDIRLVNNKTIVVKVDTSIYDNWVIDKVLYWWSQDYTITRKNSSTGIQTIFLSPKRTINTISLETIKEKLSTDFIDYKNRHTIFKETSNLRDILFAKAFANRDDFVEFKFKE